MTLEIAGDGESLIKNGTYHFVLADFPRISPVEWNNIRAFLCYEKARGAEFTIVCEDEDVLRSVMAAAEKLDGTEYIPPLAEAAEKFVYHATDLPSAQKILADGRLLAAAEVYGKTGEAIAYERRDCEWVDPPDFYEYVMFGWGTHVVGDMVVLSENFPSEEDFQKGNFDAGVRFYFRFSDIVGHRGHVFDGYHAVKVKGEVGLSDYLFACIAPVQYRERLEGCVPRELSSKVHYLAQRGLGLQEWNDRVVEYVDRL